MSLVPFGSSTNFITTLPESDQSAGYTTIVADVTNSNGNTVRVTLPQITVSPKLFMDKAAADAATTAAVTLAKDATASGDTKALGTTLLQVISIADSGATSEAAAKDARAQVFDLIASRAASASNGTVYVGTNGWQQSVEITSTLMSNASKITPQMTEKVLSVLSSSLVGSISDGASRTQLDALATTSLSIITNSASSVQQAAGSSKAEQTTANGAFRTSVADTLQLVSKTRLAMAQEGEVLTMQSQVPLGLGSAEVGTLTIVSARSSVESLQGTLVMKKVYYMSVWMNGRKSERGMDGWMEGGREWMDRRG